MHKTRKDEITNEYCFGEEASAWFLFLGVVIVLVIVISVYKYIRRPFKPHQAPASYPTAYQGAADSGGGAAGSAQQVKLVGFQPVPAAVNRGMAPPQTRYYWYVCPRCSWGRVNSMAPCPRCGYFPMRQAVSPSPANTPAANPFLIKELAMEVLPLKGFSGVLVRSVYPNGNAQKAGLMNADIITEFNGKKVKDFAGFKKAVATAKPESPTPVRFMRRGRAATATVMVGEGEMEGVTVPVAF